MSEMKEMEKRVESLNLQILKNQRSPTLYRLYRKRGHLLRKMKRYTSALKSFDRAVKLNPKSADTFVQRGIVFSLMRKSIESVEDYTRAIQLKPRCYDCYYNRGREFSHLKMYEKAIKDYTKALELNPNYSQAYNNRGGAYKHLGKMRQSMEDYQRAIELDSGNDTASTNLKKLVGTMRDATTLPAISMDGLFFGVSVVDSVNDPKRLGLMIRKNESRMKEIEYRFQESMKRLEDKKRMLELRDPEHTVVDINEMEENKMLFLEKHNPPPMMSIPELLPEMMQEVNIGGGDIKFLGTESSDL